LVGVYAVATVLGVLGIIVWVILGMVATAVAGKESLDPEGRFGLAGRSVVAALAGFGLGGMSASYAGGSTLLGIAGAVAGAVAMVLVGRYLGVEEDADGGSA
jgi:asparagine N-glycosylation enzyme membrane subunit Stt3